MKLNPNKTGLTLGALLGLFHLVWGLLVASGMGQVLLDFIYSIHFLNNPFVIQPFEVVKWITLIVVTAAVGYILGYIFAQLWNKIQK